MTWNVKSLYAETPRQCSAENEQFNDASLVWEIIDGNFEGDSVEVDVGYTLVPA